MATSVCRMEVTTTTRVCRTGSRGARRVQPWSPWRQACAGAHRGPEGGGGRCVHVDAVLFAPGDALPAGAAAVVIRHSPAASLQAQPGAVGGPQSAPNRPGGAALGGSPHRCSRPYGRPGGPQLGAGGGGAGGCGIPPPPALHARVSRTERVCMGGGGGLSSTWGRARSAPGGGQRAHSGPCTLCSPRRALHAHRQVCKGTLRPASRARSPPHTRGPGELCTLSSKRASLHCATQPRTRNPTALHARLPVCTHWSGAHSAHEACTLTSPRATSRSA